MNPTGNLVADTICRTAEIGLTITDAADVGALTIINASPVDISDTCPDCSTPGTKRDHVQRRLVDLPVVGGPDPRVVDTQPPAVSWGRKVVFPHAKEHLHGAVQA